MSAQDDMGEMLLLEEETLEQGHELPFFGERAL